MRSRIREDQVLDIDFISHAELDTVSGSLQYNIEGKSGISHLHDSRYYTESEVDTISGSLQAGINSKPDTILGLSDTPNTYDENKYLKSTTSGIEWADVSSSGSVASFSSLEFSIIPTYNGEIDFFGWYCKINDDLISLSSGNPITSDISGFSSHFVIDVVSCSGDPFNITVSGLSVDDASGAYSNFVETVSISGVGKYKTVKLFVDAPVFSIVESNKSCSINLYKITYWGASSSKFNVIGCRMEWQPDQTNWNLDLILYHVLKDGSLSIIDSADFSSSDSILRANIECPGKYKRTDYGRYINGEAGEGILVYVNQRALSRLYFEIRYNFNLDN